MVQALKGKTVDVGELCSTQPDIAVNGLGRPRRRADRARPRTLPRWSCCCELAKADKAGFEKVLNAVSAKMDTATLTDLGKQVVVDNKDIAVVAEGLAPGEGPRRVG